MKKQKKNSASGITLIALVISIIVMLILAGVSINALVGDNGVLTQTQYASFLNEMAAVEEAVQLWKTGKVIEANGAETTAIPTNGMCNVAELQNTERLVGEVGFYRLWSISNTMPTKAAIDTANPNDFNSAYDGELVFYPAGVQDLYYLNNDALDIKGNKEYLIDASTGLIYSMKGIALKGIRCYSSTMAKAIMSGDLAAPLFAEAEVSGSGAGVALAGNVSTEYVDADGKPLYKVGDKYYYEDGTEYTGTVTTNEDYNPNGFKLIASSGSHNVFKLYNNGDLYGKGLKGIQIGTPKDEMDAISPYVWKEFSVPSQIGAYEKIYSTDAGMFLIDKNHDVWSIGTKYGLTNDQRVEYTGREWVKLDLGKDSTGTSYKASKLFGTGCAVFIVTTNNNLLATGTNDYGQLGTGDKSEKTTFVQISGIDNPNSIELISGNNYANEGGTTIIKCVDSSNNNHFYLSGTDVFGGLGFGIPHNISSTTFIEIYKGVSGKGNNIANDINYIYIENHEYGIIWFKNGEVYWVGYSGAGDYGKWTMPKVVDVRYSVKVMVFKCENAGNIEYYGYARDYGLGEEYKKIKSPVKLTIPTLPEGENFVDYDIANSEAAYFLSSNGDIYAFGYKTQFGDMDDKNGWTSGGAMKLTKIDKVDSFFGNDCGTCRQMHGHLLLNKNGKYYLTNNTNIMYGDDILQKTWKKVASNVLYFDAQNTAYITRDNNLYVAGADSRVLGLGTISETRKSVDSYTLVTQSEIAGQAKEVHQMGNLTYVLTKGNQLYATGLSVDDDGHYNYSGWDYIDENNKWVYENKSTYVKIKDDVKFFMAAENYYPGRAILSTDGKLYAWGYYKGFIGQSYSETKTITEFTFPTIIGNVNNIKKWNKGGSFRSFILATDGNMYMAGQWYSIYAGGFSNKKYDFEKFTVNLTLQTDEKLVDIANIGANNCIMLTDKGRLFGFGNAYYMGIDRTDATLVENQLIEKGEINGKKITQITAGPWWYLAVDEDGKVYGTGNNVYGVLGRWKGTGRATPNSRYRTAYVWVECPELEI